MYIIEKLKQPEIEAKLAKKFHAQVGDVPYEWVIDLTPSESFRLMTYQLMLADKLLRGESISNVGRSKVRRSYCVCREKNEDGGGLGIPTAEDLFSM